MKKLLFILISLLVLCDCHRSKEIEKTNVTIKVDTIRRVDTIRSQVIINPEEILVQTDPIYLPNIMLDNISSELGYQPINIPSWSARTSRCYAEAGVINNVPYLHIKDLGDTINNQILVPHEDYVVNKDSVSITTKEVIKEVEPRFYKNTWFYVSLLLFLIILIIYKLLSK